MSDVEMAAVQAYLKEFHLPTFARLLPETLREAETQGQPFLDVLRVLLEGELAQRQINQGRRRIREARFPYVKDLAEFGFTAKPNIKKPQILSLARGEYLAKRQNLIFLGNNLYFDRRTEVFGDGQMTTALLDRLTHRAISDQRRELSIPREHADKGD